MYSYGTMPYMYRTQDFGQKMEVSTLPKILIAYKIFFKTIGPTGKISVNCSSFGLTYQLKHAFES